MKCFLKKLILFIGSVYRTLRPHWIRGKGICMGSGLKLYGLPRISAFPGSNIQLGSNISLLSSCSSNAVGLNHSVIIRTISPSAIIKIGDRVGISGAAIVARCEIVIGDDVLIGANAKIMDTDFHPISAEERISMRENRIPSRSIKIGNRAWIGAGAYILKGVVIGEESIVGAAAVVTKDVPPRTVVAGNPAKVIKEL